TGDDADKVDETADTDDDDDDKGSVGVAAALAINVSKSESLATIPTGITVVAGDGSNTGAFSLLASNNMTAQAVADGRGATGELDKAVGVAVAINVPHMTNLAVVEAGASVTGDGATVAAEMKDVSGDSRSTIGASATSGASAKDVGVAGSFAL